MCYVQYEVESVFGKCMTCDSRVWSCLRPGLPVRAAHLDQQGTGASVQAPVCRLRQLQAETDCRPNQR